MAPKTTQSTLTSAAGLALALGILLSGCTTTPPGSSSPEVPESPTAADPATPTAPSGEFDCEAVIGVLFTFVDATFSGISTSATNGEVAEKFQLAASEFDNAPVPGSPPDWAKLGQVIHSYSDEWSALDPSGAAIENLEPVEHRVDDFADSIGFNNDNYDKNTGRMLGEQCAEQFEAMYGD